MTLAPATVVVGTDLVGILVFLLIVLVVLKILDRI